jgi:hypothetical protein
MCEVRRGTNGQNTLPKYMAMSGLRKDSIDQGTGKYLQTRINQSYIYHPQGRHTHDQMYDKAWMPTKYIADL